MKKFSEAVSTIIELKNEKSLAIDEVIKDIHKCVLATKYTDEMKMFLVNRMAEIEYRLS